VKPAQEDTGLPAAEIQAQLDRIERSSEFITSERGRRFFRYVVEETIAGRGDRIKAYSIATQVLERGDGFDPQQDPVVRIEAGRIRRALERYYLTAGRMDPIVTTIPKGGYVPVFARRGRSESWRRPPLELATHAGPSQSSQPTVPRFLHPDGPSLLVTPFTYLGDEPSSRIYALGLTEEVIDQLARFKELVVVVGRDADHQGNAAIAPGPPVRYALEGSVRTSGSRIRFTTRLMDRENDGVLWSHTYDDDLSVRDLLSFQEATAQAIAATLGQPYGLVYRADFGHPSRHHPDDLEAYSGTLAYYAYRLELDPRRHASVRTILERVVDRFPEYATAWALLAMIYIDEYRFGYNPRPGVPLVLDRALDAANRAVELDPENGRALQAQMLALLFTEHVEAALAIGERALALNPNDVELMSEVGTRHALAGDRKRGIALLQRALSFRPIHARYYFAQLASVSFYNRDLPAAIDYIRKGSFDNNIVTTLMATAIFAQADSIEEAQRAAARARELQPNLSDWLREQIPTRNLRPEDRAYFVEGLRKAGLALDS